MPKSASSMQPQRGLKHRGQNYFNQSSQTAFQGVFTWICTGKVQLRYMPPTAWRGHSRTSSKTRQPLQSGPPTQSMTCWRRDLPLCGITSVEYVLHNNTINIITLLLYTRGITEAVVPTETIAVNEQCPRCSGQSRIMYSESNICTAAVYGSTNETLRPVLHL